VQTWRANQHDERSPAAESIQRTPHSQTVSVEHRSNKSRFHVFVPQQALHGANVVTNITLIPINSLSDTAIDRLWMLGVRSLLSIANSVVRATVVLIGLRSLQSHLQTWLGKRRSSFEQLAHNVGLLMILESNLAI